LRRKYRSLDLRTRPKKTGFREREGREEERKRERERRGETIAGEALI